MRRLAALAESGALPDAIETFKALLIKHLPDARTFAGNDYVQVIENQDTPENIVIIEIWQTRQHFVHGIHGMRNTKVKGSDL